MCLCWCVCAAACVCVCDCVCVHVCAFICTYYFLTHSAIFNPIYVIVVLLLETHLLCSENVARYNTTVLASLSDTGSASYFLITIRGSSKPLDIHNKCREWLVRCLLRKPMVPVSVKLGVTFGQKTFTIFTNTLTA